MTGHNSTTGPTVMLVQLPNGQTVQVRSVIQAPHPSVIQTPHPSVIQTPHPSVIQTPHPSVIQSSRAQDVQISNIAEREDSQKSVDSVTVSQKSREILSQQTSNGKILNGLSSVLDVPCIKGGKVEEDLFAVSATPTIITDTPHIPTSIYHISSGQYIAITQCGAIQLANNITDGVQGLQTLALTNAAAAAQPGATVLQYAQTSDGQQIQVPSNQVVVQAASSEVPAYSATDNLSCKREVRLMRNREAARECRRKKKEYVECLENRMAILENQNKTLIEELKALKDLYCHKSE
ncbi:cyclic AMP-responsive element-binding protein 1 [Solea senegalensis]|uniref:Cyclic AMP-responsive element-binding protein 1 n=2 Tax=Solea senegalensis TaxID=28829 RepID=A0AAV6R9R3_SOLSE|nr:cyclic AMP-responsive element-binding protein 1 [Solea senegalensis]